MKVIVCLDDNNGMLFNGRRQSRDSKVIEDIFELTEEIWIHPFSRKLFVDKGEFVKIEENFLQCANKTEYCFVENQELNPFAERIEELVVYRWNRVYPYDFKLDLDLETFVKESECEFEGTSHERITRIIYKRQESINEEY